MTPASTKDLILQLEQERVMAILSADVGALDALLHKDLVYIHRTGRIDTKATFIEGLASGKNSYQEFTRSEVKVHLHGDCAIVTGHAIMNRLGITVSLVFSNVWCQNASAWRNVLWQAVARPQEAPGGGP